ncbi:hypothetical protein [Halomonas chromatireducens]|uniref:hypothetical protein n=1 Tax=Halomonas chromatireducens TaxID=507626 RepID=UPI001F16A6EA|nr:hypothetical protein [Halomonas chromatireducens]
MQSRRSALLGGINISTNAARVDIDTLMQEYLPLLQAAAAEKSPADSHHDQLSCESAGLFG